MGYKIPKALNDILVLFLFILITIAVLRIYEIFFIFGGL